MSRVLPQVYLGYGSGYRLLYLPKTHTCGTDRQVWSSFKLRSKLQELSASSSLEIMHFHPLQLVNHHNNPWNHEQDSKGGKMGDASTHFHKKVCFYWNFYTILHQFKLLQIAHSTTLKNECMYLFSRVVSCSSPPPTHHPRKQVPMLIFDGASLKALKCTYLLV